MIGALVPVAGLIAALLYRWERDEPKMRCPRCGAVLRITDQVCMRCGEDIVWEGVPPADGPGAVGERPRGANHQS